MLNLWIQFNTNQLKILLINEYYSSYECPFFGSKLCDTFADVLQKSHYTDFENNMLYYLGIEYLYLNQFKTFWD